MGDKTTPGLAKVPSPGSTEVGTSLVIAWLNVSLDLDGALVVGPFFLASAAYLPFFEGEISGILSRECFSPMTTPFTAEVAPLGSPLPFTI